MQVCGICMSPLLPHLGYFYGAHMDCAQQAVRDAKSARFNQAVVARFKAKLEGE
jgi:DNA repair photolyase